MILSTLVVLVTTTHWPLAGDSALMHYVCFLSENGFVPYRTIQEMNLPGSYLPDWILQSVFGPSSLAWRLYDFGLLAAISLAMFRIADRRGRFAALWASCLLVLIHARDGMREAGERDLFASALLIAGVAAFLWGKRSKSIAPMFLFGLAAGSALTVKPTFIFFCLIPIADQLHSPEDRVLLARRCAAVLAGIACPLLAAFIWLASIHSLKSFAYALTVLAPYHARLGHATWRFLLYNSVSPIFFLIGLWLVADLLPRLRQTQSDELFLPDPVLRRTLLCSALAGWLSYIVQRRAYLYQRDPVLVFLLLLIALDLNALLSSKGYRHWLGATALLWTALIFAPVSTWKVAHYQSPDAIFQAQLSADLHRIDTQDHLGSLSGRVQCVDNISGCIDTLEHLQLVQTSGQIYDEFLFHPATAEAVRNDRSLFAQQVQTNPPLIFIVTAPLFPSGPNDYDKLSQWPAFDGWLNQHYSLALERTPTTGYRSMGRSVIPASYRIYVRRNIKSNVQLIRSSATTAQR